MKANSTPAQADGEQAFWLNGKLTGHFKGIRWRTSNELKFNSLWLQYYVSENTAEHNRDPEPGDRAYEIWFDDIVVSTTYVGPIKK